MVNSEWWIYSSSLTTYHLPLTIKKLSYHHHPYLLGDATFGAQLGDIGGGGQVLSAEGDIVFGLLRYNIVKQDGYFFAFGWEDG